MKIQNKTNLQNQHKFVAKKKEQGLKRVILWVRPEDVESLKEIALQPHTIAKRKAEIEHANGWFNNVIAPLCEQSEHIANEIFVGAAIRLNTSAEYLDSLQNKLNREKDIDNEMECQ